MKKLVVAADTAVGAAALLIAGTGPAWAGQKVWETDLACTEGSAYTRGSGNGDVLHTHERGGSKREKLFRNGATVKQNTYYGGLPVVTRQLITNTGTLRDTSRGCAD